MRTAQQICDDINGEQTSLTIKEVVILARDRDHWHGRAMKFEELWRNYCEAKKGKA